MQESYQTFNQKDLQALARNTIYRNINLNRLAKKSKLNIRIEKNTPDSLVEKSNTTKDPVLGAPTHEVVLDKSGSKSTSKYDIDPLPKAPGTNAS